MDFIAPELSTAYFVTFIGIAAIAVASFVILAVHIFKKRSNSNPSVIVAGVIVGLFTLMVSALALLSGPTGSLSALDRQREAARVEIQDVYGLELTEGEMAKLKYPEAEPESNFEAFGSIDKITKAGDEKLLERKLYLVWDEDSFGIFQSENGEDFVPLEAQN